MITSNITYDGHFMGHPINTEEAKGYGCHMEILYRTKLIFEYMLSHLNSIFFFSCVLTFKQGLYFPSDNSILSSFLAYYIQKLKSKDKYLYPMYLWTRECTSIEHQHYHLNIWMNGDRTQNEYGHLMLADHMWQDKLCLTCKPNSGLVDFCNKDNDGNPRINGMIISKSCPDFKSTYDFCFWRV